MFTDRERATVLAALRFWQCRGPVTTSRFGSPISVEAWWAIHDIATDCGKFAALKENEIDQVCERLNAPSEPRTTVFQRLRRQMIETIGRWAGCLYIRNTRAMYKAFARKRQAIQTDKAPEIPVDEIQFDESYCECQLPGFFYSGVPGIVAHVVNGRLSPAAKVERCDRCQRYSSDEAALAMLRRLGFCRPDGGGGAHHLQFHPQPTKGAPAHEHRAR